MHAFIYILAFDAKKLNDYYISHYRVAQKTSRTLRNYNGAYTLWNEISFGTFVDQYVLLLTYKFQWRH